MSPNLLVVAKRERIELLTPLLDSAGMRAVFFLGSKASPIFRCLRSHPEIGMLVVISDDLENVDSSLRRIQNTRSVRLIVIAGAGYDPIMVVELCQKLESAGLYRILYSYKPRNFRAFVRKSILKIPAPSFQDKKKRICSLNGHTLSLGARSAMVFDSIIKAKGKIVPWQVLRQYFSNRGTTRGAVNRLFHEIKTQYPGAERAFVKYRAVGVAFKSSLLP